MGFSSRRHGVKWLGSARSPWLGALVAVWVSWAQAQEGVAPVDSSRISTVGSSTNAPVATPLGGGPRSTGMTATNAEPAKPEGTPPSGGIAKGSAPGLVGEKPPVTRGNRILSFEVIVRLVYEKNPTVRAAREEMEAARHGLDEFRANLSRLEPFVELRSDLSDFPNRRDAFGKSVEAVVGVKKETFEGAILSAEVGGAHSRIDYDSGLLGYPDVESGGGALVRARVEMPFFGSRRRQDRIIAQAFQESTARKAQLDYLKSYSSVVDNALEYYNEALYYERLIAVYQRYAEDLQALARDRRLIPSDRARVESVRGSAETTKNIYQTRRLEDAEIIRAYLALAPEESFEIQVPEYRPSPFVEQAGHPDRLHKLLQQARENNPAFAVLDDARRNAALQRERATHGRYDVTAFLEGTTYPVGSPTYDDRYQGWTVGGGVNVRLNDRRVLEASRLKAEAEIRQFEAQIEAEELLVRRRITTETQGLLENQRNRSQILEVVRQKTEEFRLRREDYFAGRINIDQLVDTRSGLANSETSLAANLYGTSNREARLMMATGRGYELVGLRVRQAPDKK